MEQKEFNKHLFKEDICQKLVYAESKYEIRNISAEIIGYLKALRDFGIINEQDFKELDTYRVNRMYFYSCNLKEN